MTQRRLVFSLLLFFAALALPSAMLVYQAYGQLKWEAFYQHQRLARELTLRIDDGFRDLIEREGRRPVNDYEFFSVAGADSGGLQQRSPLSELITAPATGLLGYFQVDTSGRLRTPVVPTATAPDYGITALEMRQRREQERRIRGILDRNRLVTRTDVPPMATELDEMVAADAITLQEQIHAFSSENDSAVQSRSLGSSVTGGQSAFDSLAKRKSVVSSNSAAPVAQVKDLKLEDRYRVAASPESDLLSTDTGKPLQSESIEKQQLEQPAGRLEVASPPAYAIELQDDAEQIGRRPIRIETFESEIEPMEFALLDSGHFVLFRRVWHQNERYVQGILFDQTSFFEQLIVPAFRESSLSSMSALIVAYQGSILQNYAADYSRGYQPSAEQTSNELLYQSRLIAPFGDIELIYTLARLPIGAGAQVVIWSALVLVVVLIGGCLMLWRLGRRQLALARQQQDFVSAVSHELKTPLTSIRLYGEMLRAGWADETKRQSYYDFIFHEAERLTRLINNVLQLAHMSRNEPSVNLSAITISEALAELRPRLETQLEPSGFTLTIDGDVAADAANIEIDIDWFIQIFINLVDNAAKFSAGAETAHIDLRYQRLHSGKIEFAVRDYGPGIAADQMKKIFTLFYRSENELTRETVGTGIGLALVQQLAVAMRAEVDVVNCDPGAEFRIRFNVIDTST